MMMKSRNIPVGRYIEILEEEAIQALIRSKIFTKKKDKNFWRTTFEKKCEKIEDLCENNNIQPLTISEKRWKDAVNRVVPESGLPKFTYSSEAQRLGNGYYPGLQELDERYYFGVDSEVIHNEELYSIVIVDKESCTIKNQKTESVLRLPKSDIRRVLVLNGK